MESIDERRAAQQFVWARRALRRASRRLCDLDATIVINHSRCLTTTALIDAQLGDRSLSSTSG